MNARLYLATAYASQYIPGAPSEQNVRLGTQAVNDQGSLQIDPNNLSAIDGIGSILSRWPALPTIPKSLRSQVLPSEAHRVEAQ